MINTEIEAWALSEKTINRSRRYYAHFDNRTDFSKCWGYISVPENISRHSFYPFIHYVKKMNKFSKAQGLKPKERDICYASHIDRCIFQYYNFILNSLYNERCDKLGTGDVAVAYRTNLTGQSNIHFAKRAISFIQQSETCFIMVGDFTSFFDSLDHNYLKKRWCSLLKEFKLPPDHYAVFKNITRYSKIELFDLLAMHGLEINKKGIRELNSKERVLSLSELRKMASTLPKNKVGIPQGSPMSGILANIYMLDADKMLFDLISSLNGIYMRYSDDFIVVLPNLEENIAIEKMKIISCLLNGSDYPGLELQPSKTQYFRYDHGTISNCGLEINSSADCSNPHLDFLGFSFDGSEISLRGKTISKFYQRMRRKAKTISKSGGYTKNGNHISNKNLYEKYSERGAFSKKGNFLSYINRAEKEFGEDEPIHQIPKRNMYKIRMFLKKDY